MRFDIDIQYTACRTLHLDADSTEAAERIARERHAEASLGQVGDMEEVTWVRATPASSGPARWPEPIVPALRLGDLIGTCGGCGRDVTDGPTEDCNYDEGCGALKGTTPMPYELVALRSLLWRYVDAITNGSYACERQAIVDILRDVRALPKAGGEPALPEVLPGDPPIAVTLSVADHMRIHVGLTLATRHNPLDPGYLELRERLDNIVERELAANGGSDSPVAAVG